MKVQWLGGKHFFDDHGQLFDAHDIGLKHTLGVAEATPKILSFAVENMGFIALLDHVRRVDIQLRPRVIGSKTAGALCYWLMTGPDVPVRMCWHNEDHWVISYCVSARAAVEHFSLLLNRPMQTVLKERLLAIDSVEAKENWLRFEPSLMRTLEAGTVTTQTLSHLDNSFGQRWSVVEVDRSNSNIIVTHKGRAAPQVDPVFCSGRGFNLREVHDADYQSSLESVFVGVAKTGRRVFQHYDAIIEHPTMGQVRTQGWRAIVPIKCSELSCQLVSVTGQDSSINLRRVKKAL
jgi:hypothetical protein